MPIMLEQKPALRQTVSLSQRQSLTVLAMGSMELKEFIDREQLENPLLEVEGGPGAGDRLEDIAQWFRDTMPVVEEGVYRDEEGRPEPAAPSGRTYREDLKEQLYSLEAGNGRRERAERMVDLIDPRGFLPYTDLELCRMLGCSPGACQAALAILRALEPPGVGSRDLGEYLTRQLAAKGLLSPALSEICSSFLPLVAEGRYREISAALGLELPVVRQCVRLIAALRPSPLEGSREADSPAEYLVPDIVVRRGERGLVAAVNRRWAGQVRISVYYKAYLESAGSPEVRDYLRGKIRRARWVIAAVEQRRKTLEALAGELVRLQEEFFLGGSLRRVTLRQAAEAMGVHESTVSRAVSGKYLRCARGTYPLKYFFTAGVSSAGKGASMGRESVKERILQLIREEDKAHPLSDAAICERLREEGLEISRRTVAKYRAECGVPSAFLRP